MAVLPFCRSVVRWSYNGRAGCGEGSAARRAGNQAAGSGEAPGERTAEWTTRQEGSESHQPSWLLSNPLGHRVWRSCLTSLRSALVRSAPRKLASLSSAQLRLAFQSLASIRLALLRLVQLSLARLRSAPLRGPPCALSAQSCSGDTPPGTTGSQCRSRRHTQRASRTSDGTAPEVRGAHGPPSNPQG